MRKCKYLVGGLLAAIITYAAALLIFFPETAQARLIAGVTSHNHSSAAAGGTSLNPTTLTIPSSTAVTNSTACDAGYVRTGYNFCLRTTNLGNSSLTASTCTLIALPTNAKALWIWSSLAVSSQNAVGQRNVQLNGYSENTCTSPNLAQINIQGYEYSAVLSTTIDNLQTYFILPVTTAAPYLKWTGATGSQVLYQVRGYWD